MTSEILTWGEVCLAAGSPDEARRQVRGGQYCRIRRGMYVRGRLPPSAAAIHRLLLAATVPLLKCPVILANESAAVLHGLPLLGPLLTSVHVSARPGRGGRSSAGVIRHAVVDDPPTTTVAGYTVTSPARTVIDLARSHSIRAGVVAADHALRHGLVTREDLAEAVSGLANTNGVKAARQVVSLADGRSESPGESISRILILELGFACPDLQVEVVTADGRVHRCDFGWEGGLVGEFDGREKYHRADGSGTPEDRLWEEKRREDAIRATGRRMVRWVYADLTREKLGPILSNAGVPRRPLKPVSRGDHSDQPE